MKHLHLSFLFFLPVFLLSSCLISKYSAPPFTDLEKILQLKPGQTVSEVSSALKIRPYDVVYSHEAGRMILIFNYRVKDRRMTLPKKSAQQVIHGEESQRAGDLWYNDNYRELFVLFQNEKLKSVYGEEVLAVAADIELMDNHLYHAADRELSEADRAAREDIRFVATTYQQRYKKRQAELSDDKANKTKQRIALVGGALILSVIIGLFSN
ncbi:MAG: hypothetical protein R3D58_04770 [Saprospiraceae bacterium]|nr:hypothetical protein [Lewinellaceae bacterium]